MNAPTRYIVTPCPFGCLLVAASDKGVAVVGIGSANGELEAEFRRNYARALYSHDEQLSAWAGAVLHVIDGAQAAEEVPLDVEGTDFQWRVWRALMLIPYGSTRTYGEIARGLGSPGAARAVGRACATNPVALVIPCHRAVGSDYKLHGFRWGLQHKTRLLEYERSRTLGATGQTSFLDCDD